MLKLLLEDLTVLLCRSLELYTPGERMILDSWGLETQKVRKESSRKVFFWSVSLLQIYRLPNPFGAAVEVKAFSGKYTWIGDLFLSLRILTRKGMQGQGI